MNLWKTFWNDDLGLILSAEAVLLGTVGVIGATVGLSAVSRSINEELTETAFAFRSLDQSYSIRGFRSCGASTASSIYVQRPVEESIERLCAELEELERDEQRREEELRRHEEEREHREEHKPSKKPEKKPKKTNKSA